MSVKMYNKLSNQSMSIEDKKREYLIKTLSRTKRKDYENYIINRIYHKLNRLDVKPVTQQYVKRSDGRYALIDLYFPQINYGIECDEKYHLEHDEEDRIRTLSIEEMLDSVEETQGFILRRVKAYESIDSIENQINDIVHEIQTILINRQIKPWVVKLDAAEESIKKQIIRVEDHLEFDKITMIARCFGKNYKGYQKSGIPLGEGYSVWCPKLAVMVEGKAEAVANGWINTLSSDWNYIYEENHKKGDIRYAVGETNQYRIIFAKSKNNLGQNYYRFLGVFQFDKKHSTKSKNVYVRVATEINLTPWLNHSL